MANDSEADAGDEEDVFDEAVDSEGEPDREVQLVEDDAGFWTLVDSERGAVGDAPTKAAGLTLMEQYLEEMEDVTVPDVEPEEPEEDDRPDTDPKVAPMFEDDE